MNILLLTQFLSVTKGGGEYVFSILANTLAQRGHRVWVITHKIENEDYSRFHDNIRIIFVSSIKYEGGLPPSFKDNMKYTLQTILQGLRVIMKEKIDIIHSNNFSPALAGSILSSLRNKHHITTVHDIFSLCGKDYWKMWGRQSNLSTLNVMLAPFFEKMIIKLRHDAIHTVSEATENDLIKFGAKKPIYVIHNAIKDNKLEKLEKIPFQFLFVGRLVFYKNLEVVIKAVDIVKKRYPQISLIIAGSGPYRKNLEKLVIDLNLHDNVKFIGFVNDEEKMRLFSTSQALVLPSLCEGFGLVILESFSCNCPAIVSNVKPLSDIIDDNKDGLVVDAKDENKWAESIVHFIQHPEDVIKMGEAAKKKLEQKYNISHMINKIESMYQEVISK